MLGFYKHQIEQVMAMRCPRAKVNKKGKPWICKGHRATKYAYQYAFEVPTGYSYLDIEKQVDALYAACGAVIEFKDKAGVVEIHVLRVDFPDVLPFRPEYFSLTEGRTVMIGMTRQGEPISHNFKTPHMVVAGASGYGKTDATRWILLQLISRFTPDELEIDVIDMKRFSFLPFKDIPHIRRVTGTMEEAVEVLQDAYDTMMERADEVVAMGDRSLTKDFKWRIVLVDEASMLSPKLSTDGADKKVAMKAASLMSKISCVGREASVGLIFCTQYPTAEVIAGQIRANMEAVVCFKTENDVHSNVAIGASGAEKLGKPGRAFYKSPQGRVIVQVPFVGDDDAWREVLADYALGGEAEAKCPIPALENPGHVNTADWGGGVEIEWFSEQENKHDFDGAEAQENGGVSSTVD